MLSSHWFKIAGTISTIGFYSTSATTTLFIILTLFFVKDNIGSYRRLLLLLPITGFLFASTEFVVRPYYHSYNAGFTIITTNNYFNLSHATSQYFICTFCGFYMMTISTLALQFLYRYWAVFHPPNIRYFFDGSRMVYAVIYVIVLGIVWGADILFLGGCDEYSKRYMKEVVFENYGLIMEETTCINFIAYDAEGKIRWKNLWSIIVMTLIMNSQYTIIIYCALELGRNMKKKLENLSRRAQKMHRQFFHVLIVQITAPTLFLFAPVFALLYAPYLNLKFSFPTGVVLSAFDIYPGMDCLIVFYMASYYRQALRKMIQSILDIFALFNLEGLVHRTPPPSPKQAEVEGKGDVALAHRTRGAWS